MEDSKLKNQVEIIRTAFSYINRFKNSTFVIKIEGSLLDNPLFPLLIKDIVLLHRMDIRIILIPGARKRIDEVLKQNNIKCRYKDGIRISPPQAMSYIKMASFDVANKIMTLLAEHNINAIIGNWVKARSLGIINGVDFQSSGSVEKLKIEIIRSVLDQHLVPIFPNIGWSATGKPYNISSNELASTISKELKATKLFFIIDFAGISASGFNLPAGIDMRYGDIVSHFTLQQAAEFVRCNKHKNTQLQIELIKMAYNACKNGVERAHIIDGRVEGMLLKEIFSNQGLGTMVYSNPHENIRPVQHQDMPEILRIMQPAVEDELLIPRTTADIEDNLADYAVYEVDGIIHACGALHQYDNKTGEIAAMAVDTSYSNLGIGHKMVSYFLEKAVNLKLKKVFVLTTQAIDWFLEHGFIQAKKSDLPAWRQKKYSPKRNSRVLLYRIAPNKKGKTLAVE